VIHHLKTDHSQIVDALELKNAITFTGPGPFPAGHQIGSPGDYLVNFADGTQKIMHSYEFEAFEPAPILDEPAAHKGHKKAHKA